MYGIHIANVLQSVLKRIEDAKIKAKRDDDVILITVSESISKMGIVEMYHCGQRHFGENYVNELAEKVDKHGFIRLLELCQDMKWHFIGHLQSDKVSKLLRVENLYMVHTVVSKELAALMNKTWYELRKPEPLKIMIQVNTSGEESKSGISPEEAVNLAQYVIEECKYLHLAGLMLIGYANYDHLTSGPNPEFKMLSDIKNAICEKFSLDPRNFGLSMGMSQDFEHAIELGSNYVRVGSGIFGPCAKMM